MLPTDTITAAIAALAVVLSTVALVRDAGRGRRAAALECHRLLGEAWVFYLRVANVDPSMRDPEDVTGFLVKTDQAALVDPKNARLMTYLGYAADLRGDRELAARFFRAAAPTGLSILWAKIHGFREGEVRLPAGRAGALLQLTRHVDTTVAIEYCRLVARDRSRRVEALLQESRVWQDASPPRLDDAERSYAAAEALAPELAEVYEVGARIADSRGKDAMCDDAKIAAWRVAEDRLSRAATWSSGRQLVATMVSLALLYEKLAGLVAAEEATSMRTWAGELLNYATVSSSEKDADASRVAAAIFADRALMTAGQGDKASAEASANEALAAFDRAFTVDPRWVLPTEKYRELRDQMVAIVGRRSGRS